MLLYFLDCGAIGGDVEVAASVGVDRVKDGLKQVVVGTGSQLKRRSISPVSHEAHRPRRLITPDLAIRS